MQMVMAVAAGGALGALGRYGMARAMHRATETFPWATLTVNVLGSLLIGAVAVWLMERGEPDPALRAFLMVGVLGGFTTFSTFSLETVALLERGALVSAGTNMLASVVLCVAGAWLGMTLARQLA